ncbi:thymidine phosphorylase [Afifella sp. JA880]|uniref:thymidine phosphorylase n=1 Tax=Afifella sp. JA880 TaxID=2975280 RepID=UPI0021BB62BA|nr:thymidine phosphorylase [Afifella sp. JA880]MCT8269097.1 thymidine phosphorylase [Afifella sp. JA880]
MSFLPQEIIRNKRDGTALSADEITFFVQGLTDGSVTEGQVAALAMAVFFRGMDEAEIVALTQAMTRSGDVLTWPEADAPILDKHSTGGIGDNVSLMLAPIVAACGGLVPMISGRGLGHTGGTLDKLGSIPGYKTQPDLATFRKVVAEAGCAIIGQTGDLAPADKRFYGIRDVTATVESVPLITASILSKKLAAGLSGLVLDVKTGTGAFMADPADAHRLAESLVTVAKGAGLPAAALITDMNEPLASAAGNAVEVQNAVDFLTGRHRDRRLEKVTIALVGEMLRLGALASSAEAGEEMARTALANGEAAERFQKMVSALGGPADFVENPEGHLPKAPFARTVGSASTGYVEAIDTRAIGVAVVTLGGGRRRAEDTIDHAVGVTQLAAIGDEVGPEHPLALVHARDEEAFADAAHAIRRAYHIAETPVSANPLIVERLQ